MNLQKLNPWNWFKHEESHPRDAGQVPVTRERNPSANEDRHFPLSYHPVFRLHEEIDRLFDSAFSEVGFPRLGLPSTRRLFDAALPDWRNERWLRPNVDVAGDEKKYEISLDLPGLTEKDISVEVRGDTLIVKGEKQETLDESKDKKFYRVERRYGSFQRTLSLPEDADADAIQASLRNGVLTLEIPRKQVAEKSDVKRIPIQQ